MPEGEHNMVRLFIIIFHLCFFLLQANPSAGNDDLSLVLEGIRKNYSNCPCITITYSREVITRSMSMLGNEVKGDMAAGRMYFKSPYSLKMEQKTPETETIISDGDTIWWYIPAKRTAHRYSSLKFGKELRLLSDIFRGLTRVEDNFVVKLADDKIEGGFKIEMTPDPPWREVDHILLAVTRGYNIRVVEIFNRIGGKTKFTFDEKIKKEKFEEGFFKFHVPEGVKIVDEEGIQENKINKSLPLKEDVLP